MPDQHATDSILDFDEAVLAERARARDPDAWTAIYERHYQPIFRYVHARVFDREVADPEQDKVKLKQVLVALQVPAYGK
jgi:hypothetical protein